MSSLKEFYKKCDLVLKPNPQWRLFKFQMKSGAWYTVPRQIMNEDILRRLLIRYAPINVFSTVCCFRNPLALNDENFRYAGHIYMSDDSFMFIDIDDFDKRTAKKAKVLMLEEGRYELWKELNSGNGIHQLYFDNEAIQYKDPLRKMDYQMRLRACLVERFKNNNIIFDHKCLIDLTRVSRVIGTPNDGNINKVCKEIHNYKDLQRRKPMTEGESSPDTLPHNIHTGEACRSPSPVPSLMKFTDNMVQGIKDMYISYLRINKSKRNLENVLIGVTNFYRLGELFLFESNKHIHVLSLKAIHKNKYLKVLRYTKAANLKEFLKHGHSWIRISSLLDKDGKKIEGPLKFIGKIGRGYPAGEYSRPHYNLLKKWKIDLPENITLMGNEANSYHLAYRPEAIGT